MGSVDAGELLRVGTSSPRTGFMDGTFPVAPHSRRLHLIDSFRSGGTLSGRGRFENGGRFLG